MLRILAALVAVVIMIQAATVNVNAQEVAGASAPSPYGAQFKIAEFHYANEKYFSEGKTVFFDGLYQADWEGVMTVEIQQRRNETIPWTTIKTVEINYDNQVHWNPCRGQYLRGVYHKIDLKIEKGGEYRLYFKNENNNLTTVHCTDVRFK